MRAYLAAAMALSVLGGCASYDGQKLGIHTSTGKSTAPRGIPYSLSRPVYMLTRSVPADDNPPEYTLAVSYEADPRHTYSLRLDTAPFTDPDFLVQLGDDGILTGTKSTTSETLTPAITAIGSFVSNVLGGKALMVADKGGGLATTIDDLVQESNEIECTRPADQPGANYMRTVEGAAPTTIKQQINRQIASYVTEKEFLARWHYLTNGELLCLKKVRDTIAKDATSKAAETDEEWMEARAAHLKDYPADKPFVDALSAAAETSDAEAMPRLKEQASEAATTTDAQRLKRQQTYSTVERQIRARRVDNAAKQLDEVIGMNAANWRARHVLYLEDQLAKLELYLLRHPLKLRDKSVVAAAASWQSALRSERASTLGVMSQYARLTALARFLETIPVKTGHGGKAPATTEYATARAEFDSLNAAIDARRTKVLADAAPKPAPAIKPVNNTRIEVVSTAQIVASKSGNWSTTDAGKKAARFVMVLREAQ